MHIWLGSCKSLRNCQTIHIVEDNTHYSDGLYGVWVVGECDNESFAAFVKIRMGYS